MKNFHKFLSVTSFAKGYMLQCLLIRSINTTGGTDKINSQSLEDTGTFRKKYNFGKYTFRRYIFKKQTLSDHTLSENNFRKIHFQKYTF